MIEGKSGSNRVVTRIAVTFRDSEDPGAREKTVTLMHGRGGADVDGVIWSDELMRKLAYLEGDDCVMPKKLTGRDEWKLETAGTESEVGAPCIWVHRSDCNWEEYCPDE